MLAKIAPKFVISRVIQTSYYAHYMGVEILKQTFGESAIDFYINDAKKYFVKLNPLRNATFMDTSQHFHHQLNSQINSRLINIIRL